MPSSGSGFMPIERAVLQAICEMCSMDRDALKAQLSTATILRREYTGAGFYTYFSVDRASNRAIGGESPRSGPNARIEGLEHGMGFILWLKEGYADCLERYSLDESTTEVAFERVGFKILKAGESVPRSETDLLTPKSTLPSSTLSPL